MEHLLLSDYLVGCIEFEKDPTEENQKNIQEFLNKMVVKSYLGHKDKEMAMMSVLSTLPAELDAVAATGQYEISKIVYGLLPYATNLENDINLATVTFFAIDCMYNHGLISTIMHYCNEDYHRLEKMIDDSIRFDGVYKMLSTLSLIDGSEYDKWMETMKNLKQEFTPEMIKALSSLAVEGNESFAALKKELSEAALEQAQMDMTEKKKTIADLEEKITDDKKEA